jgi:hypothetical protein
LFYDYSVPVADVSVTATAVSFRFVSHPRVTTVDRAILSFPKVGARMFLQIRTTVPTARSWRSVGLCAVGIATWNTGPSDFLLAHGRLTWKEHGRGWFVGSWDGIGCVALLYSGVGLMQLDFFLRNWKLTPPSLEYISEIMRRLYQAPKTGESVDR